MRILAIVLLLFPATLAAQDMTPAGSHGSGLHPGGMGDRFLAADKAGHLMAGMVLTGVGTWLHQRFDNRGERSVMFGMSFALSAGLIKELRDWAAGSGHASWKDFIAGAAGCLLGGLIMSQVVS